MCIIYWVVCIFRLGGLHLPLSGPPTPQQTDSHPCTRPLIAGAKDGLCRDSIEKIDLGSAGSGGPFVSILYFQKPKSFVKLFCFMGN